MTALTRNDKSIHWAIERCALDGPYVTLLTHDTRVVRREMSAWEAEIEEDEAAYEAASEDEQEAWVWGPTQRAIPYEAGQEVWLGFPFDQRGAKEWKPEEGFGPTWENEQKEVREVCRLSREGGWSK
jgi:hypothetical protein